MVEQIEVKSKYLNTTQEEKSKELHSMLDEVLKADKKLAVLCNFNKDGDMRMIVFGSKMKDSETLMVFVEAMKQIATKSEVMV
jgi:hypothetical protein